MLLEKKKERSHDIPTSSMADIAFLLLIFFLVTTTMDMDIGIPMVLPERGGEARINPLNISRILINDAGQLLFDGQQVSDSELRELLEVKLRERGLDMEGNPRLIVSIKTDRLTEYNRYIEVLDVVKLSGATRISIAEPDRE